MIVRRQHRAICACHVFVLGLHAGGLHVVFILKLALLRRGPGINASAPAVKAHPADGGVSDHGPVDIGVVDADHVYVGHGAIVKEPATTPISSNEANAAITKAIINAAVEANVGSPVPCVPAISAADKPPISRSPEQAHGWRRYPRAWNPVVSIRSVSPVTRRPEIPWFRTRRLH